MGVSININKTLGVAAGTSIISPQTDSFTNTYSIEGDGVDDFVNCGTNSSLNFERTDTFSYSLWVKRNIVNTTNHMLLSKMNPSGNRRGMFFNLNSESKIVVMLRTDTSFTSQRLFWKTNELIKIAKSKKLLLSEATLFHYHKVFHKILKIIGGKNKLQFLQSHFNIPQVKSTKDINYTKSDCFMDMSPYAAALIRLYLNKNNLRVNFE